MGFIGIPELNNYYEGYGDTAMISNKIALELLSTWLPGNTVTLLNPSNYYEFYYLYQEGEYE